MAEKQDGTLRQPGTGDKSDCADSAIPETRQPYLPHALPFRCIFEELWQRRGGDLEKEVQRVFKVAPGEERATLDQKIDDSAAAYAALLNSKDENNYGDRYEQCCQTADQKLLDVLHGMDCSALCLSGGGIRSASFCLGILQGLARFGFSAENERYSHVLLQLDYLSTVSGGGYIGSWLMAWTKRLATPTQGAPIVAGGTNSSACAFWDVVTALAGRNPHT